MDVARRSALLLEMSEGLVAPGVKAGKPTVVTAYPDASLTIFAETADDLAMQGVAVGRRGIGREDARTGAGIVDAAIISAYPQAALVVAQDGIDELVVDRTFVEFDGQEVLCATRSHLVARHTVVRANVEDAWGIFHQGMDVAEGDLLNPPHHSKSMRIESNEAVIPGANPDQSARILHHR